MVPYHSSEIRSLFLMKLSRDTLFKIGHIFGLWKPKIFLVIYSFFFLLKNCLGFPIPKILKILQCFARQFHQELTSVYTCIQHLSNVNWLGDTTC